MSVKFQYPDELGFELPMLILAVRAQPSDGVVGYPLRDPWRARLGMERLMPLRHQTAGHGCHHHDLWALPLQPRSETAVAMFRLDKQWYGSNAGVFGVSLDELLLYREQLNGWLGVDCNRSYRDFEEAIYPIDPSADGLRTLTVSDLPDDLDDLVEWTRPEDPPHDRERRAALRRLLGFVHRWTVYVLAENSD